MEQNVFFVSGTDTNIGKTYATGLLARALARHGRNVITQKMIQTGCTGRSEDIETHRRIQGIPFTDEDREGLTCPYIFTYPCSPHMAAQRDGRTLSLSTITAATQRLRQKHTYVLLEGAGGLMVPTHPHTLTIDYLSHCRYPLLLVASGKLGSINHTLLSLFACKHYGIRVAAVIYNLYPHTDSLIEANTLAYLRQHLQREFPGTLLAVMPEEQAALHDDSWCDELLQKLFPPQPQSR